MVTSLNKFQLEKPDRTSLKGKAKSLGLTSVAPSVTRLVSVEANGVPFTPPASVSAPFHGYSKLWLQGSEESRNRRLGD